VTECESTKSKNDECLEVHTVMSKKSLKTILLIQKL